MNQRLFRLRRVGVAAIAGVTALGAAAVIGEGVASAAPTVAATTSSVQTIAGTATAAQAGGQITLQVTGTITTHDQVILTLGCPTTGTLAFNLASTTVGDNANLGWQKAVNSNGACGTADNQLILTPTSAGTNDTVLVTPYYDATGVSPGAVSLSGVYSQLGSTSNFSVASNATVSWYTVTSNVPPVTLQPSTTNQAISDLGITQPANVPSPTGTTSNAIGGTVGTAALTYTPPTSATLTSNATTIPNGTQGTPYSASLTVTGGTAPYTWTTPSMPAGLTATTSGGTLTISGTPTAAQAATNLSFTVADSATPANTLTIAAPLVINQTPTVDVTLTGSGDTWASAVPSVTQAGSSTSASAKASGSTLTITVGSVPSLSTSTLFRVSGLMVNTGSSTGAVMANVTLTNYTGTTAVTPVTLASNVVVGSTLGTSTRIYGADGTADGTVAQEFMSAFPTNATNQSGGNTSVVLATDADPYDALSASYLEGQLGTGLLITPPSKLGTDAQTAMRIEGVQTVYVVGGPDAITPSVIKQIEATPAYKPGGLVETGANLKVVGPIYGSTAVDTAQKIASYFGSAFGTVPAISAAYSASSTTNGGGLYNNTTGSSSASGPAAATPSAIVVSSTDWQDAMSIAPEAYALRIPVVLTSATSLSTQASATLTSLGVKQVLAIGGPLALTNNVVTQIQALNGGTSVLRIAGKDATDTAGEIASFALSTNGAGTGLGWTSSGVLASHGNYWSDALGAAALGGGANQTSFGYEPLVLVKNPTTVGNYTGSYLTTLAKFGVAKVNVLGGMLAMPSTIVNTLLASIAAG